MSWACIQRMGLNMTRYSWMIHTANEAADGALGAVYLSLHGLKASTRELLLPMRDYKGGTVASGIVEVGGHLGELLTGSLRTEDSERSEWTPDWIRVVNLSDGRQWTARGATCDPDGSCSLLQFVRTRGPVELQKSKGDPHRTSYEASDPEPMGDRPSEAKRSDAERGGPSTAGSPTNTGTVARTYEIFGTHRGRVVPLSEILQIRAGTKQLTPGARILLTDQESQGFGLGGEPGLWEDLYPGVDPALYGLDSDKPILAGDGSRGWVVDAHYLAMIFGADWRRVVYGN